jgi:hypothetical protein
MSTPTKKRATPSKSLVAKPKAPHAHANSPAHARIQRPDSGEAFLHDPTESNPRMHSSDPLAEMLGEQFVEGVNAGEEAYSVDVDRMTTDELGGPFTTFAVPRNPYAESESKGATTTMAEIAARSATPKRIARARLAR